MGKVNKKARVGITILVLAVASAGWSGPGSLWLLWLAGRSPNCPLSHALQAQRHRQHLMATKDQILTQCQLLEADPAGFWHWRTPYGNFWIPDPKPYTLAFNLAEEAVGIYRGRSVAVRPGDVVLDCGANVGVFTRAALAAGASLVVAIEPVPENIECLRRNFSEQIRQGRVVLYPKGVWNQDAELAIRYDRETHAADSFVMEQPGWKPGPKLPLTTIDKLVEELDLARVDFIKMDIEGAEPRAIDGARRTLRRWKPRLALSAYHAPDHPHRIPDRVRAANPEYELECGVCSEADGWIRPDVLFFH